VSLIPLFTRDFLKIICTEVIAMFTYCDNLRNTSSTLMISNKSSENVTQFKYLGMAEELREH